MQLSLPRKVLTGKCSVKRNELLGELNSSMLERHTYEPVALHCTVQPRQLTLCAAMRAFLYGHSTVKIAPTYIQSNSVAVTPELVLCLLKDAVEHFLEDKKRALETTSI